MDCCLDGPGRFASESALVTAWLRQFGAILAKGGPIVVEAKDDGRARLCVDFQNAAEAAQAAREAHALIAMTLEDAAASDDLRRIVESYHGCDDGE